MYCIGTCLQGSVERRASDSTAHHTFFYHRLVHFESDAAVEAVYRADWGRIVAALISLVGDFEIAEEASQEAFVAAIDQWRTSGVPKFPRAWIIQTARHKAIDRIRHIARQRERFAAY